MRVVVSETRRQIGRGGFSRVPPYRCFFLLSDTADNDGDRLASAVAIIAGKIDYQVASHVPSLADLPEMLGFE